MAHPHPQPVSQTPSSRELILDAAREELGAQGYEGATLRSIARRAAVDPRLIRHYFSGKPELVREALGFDVLIAQMGDRVLAHPAGTSLGRRLYRLGTRFWDSEPTLWQALIASSMSAEPQVRAAFTKLIDCMVEALSGGPDEDAGPEMVLRAELALGNLLGLWVTRRMLEAADRPEWAAIEGPAADGLDRLLAGS